MLKRIQITAGTGPRECGYVVAQLLEVIEADAKRNRVEFDVTRVVIWNGSGPRAIQSAIISINGKSAEAFVYGWVGTVQWIGISPYRPGHKRKNWFIAVQRVVEVELDIRTGVAIKFETMRASGPGGQHVNKTASAVRATDSENGITVTVQTSRSQAQNKKVAVRKIRDELKQRSVERVQVEKTESRGQHFEVERGNPARVFIGTDFIERS